MGLGKKILGGAEIAGGIASEAFAPGNPGGSALIARGMKTVTSSPAQKPGISSPGGMRTTPGASAPPRVAAPSSASSIDQARGQDRARMKSVYGYP